MQGYWIGRQGVVGEVCFNKSGKETIDCRNDENTKKMAEYEKTSTSPAPPHRAES